jgi:tetratricopeptide (TPR) repeat protein
LNQLDAAIECYDKAIALKPDFFSAYYNKSLLLLVSGYLEQGWPLYEFRLKSDTLNKRQFDIPEKLWLGKEPLQGKTILLCHEQGLGDVIQFGRYAKLLSELGAKVILEVQPHLFNLLKNLEGVDELIASNQKDLTLQNMDQYPPFDIYCPLMSLPLAFGTTLDTIPNKTPYLAANPEKITAWEKRMGPKTKPRVGIVVSGNIINTNDHNRSIMLAQLLPYLPDNCEYISLQKDVRDIDKIIFAAMTEWKLYGEELNDFSDTAALCSLMDVVISVDTSVAHLSGALGKPTWVLLPFSPDWRWLLERRDSPWYSSVRLYRQSEPTNWNNVLEEIRTDLLKISGT